MAYQFRTERLALSIYTDCNYEHFDTWDALRETLLRDAGPDFAWRGMPNAQWCLETTLDRFAKQIGKTDRSLITKQLAELYQTYLVEVGLGGAESLERLWALGQHYGLPTPFLDWSRSPMAATYFALRGEDPNTERKLRDACIFRLRVTDTFLRGGDVTLVEVGSGPWNVRLRAQQGIFTELKRGECLIDILKRNNGYLDSLVAYTFPAALLADAASDLTAMMIDDLHMFPDHEGVVRHVRTLAKE